MALNNGVHAQAEADVKAEIRKHLRAALPECFIPELGEPKKGKVREIYFTGDNVLMVTNDRVSAFDFILPNLIPFKGEVLNRISEYTMSQTKDIVPNALIENVDPSIVLQKRMRNLNVEWIVRGHLWGGMAAGYERGQRNFCGLNVPDGLLRGQKFDTPIFTPTTKAEVGHDEDMTMSEVEALVGAPMAAKARDAALRLFARGQEVMRQRGLILIDTKYEFGVDEAGELHVIDEVNTPDSSRLCDIQEWEDKYPKIAAEMATGAYATVTDLMKTRPDLKIKELSKQYVRDALLDLGFDPAKATGAPQLTDEQVVECASRYVTMCERITGRKFDFPASSVTPQRRIIQNLQSRGIVTGACVVIIAGSDTDVPHSKILQKELKSFGIPSYVRICSAHKQPGALEAMIKGYNKSIQPMLIVSSVGGTDALSGTLSYLSEHPVISCPSDGMNSSCLTNPPGSCNGFILNPANVAKFAAQMFALQCPSVKVALRASIEDTISDLEKLDTGLQAGAVQASAGPEKVDVLVVGSGGREHAIAAKMAASPRVRQVFCAPGNGGTASEPRVMNVAVSDSDIPGLVALAQERKVALVFVGPEAPLCAGLADALAAAKIPCFGPTKLAAKLEESKAFSKAFFARHGLPTAAFRNFGSGDYNAACEYIRGEYDKGRQVVVKASGLAAGKGVLMPTTLNEALDAAKTVMLDKAFGAAGDEVVVEQLLVGEEVSCMAFCDGKVASMMPPAQDHKRALDGDEGLNTGGMGAYAPAPCLIPRVRSEVQHVLQKTVEAMAKEGRPYIGVLYGGFMLTPEGPTLLEYNCRFGDPETQVLLPLLDSDLFEIALGCAEGNLARRVPEVEWKGGAAATVVCAASGYPGSYPKGLPISGLQEAGSEAGVKVYHAGTKMTDSGHVSSGGRVLAVTGLGRDFKEALSSAYRGVGRIAFTPADGLHLRRDIGHRALARPVRIGLIGSTRGSSSQWVFDAIKEGSLNATVSLVVSNKADAGILERGEREGSRSVHLPCAKGTPRGEYDARVTEALRDEGIDLVLLVGYMRIVSAGFCAAWEGRCVNIHPSLLPKHAGGMDLEVHRAVLAAGETESGCTVHLVTEQVDGGPVVVQREVKVEQTDTPESLKAKVQAQEGPALVDAVRAFAEGRIPRNSP